MSATVNFVYRNDLYGVRKEEQGADNWAIVNIEYGTTECRSDCLPNAILYADALDACLQDITRKPTDRGSGNVVPIPTSTH